jgi:glycogen synthase
MREKIEGMIEIWLVFPKLHKEMLRALGQFCILQKNGFSPNTTTKPHGIMEKEKAKKMTVKPQILFELAWEVCNQVGGIYTVIRTKVPSMVEKWGADYWLIGPYFAQTAVAEFEPLAAADDSPVGRVIDKMRQMGMEVHYGHWLVTGRPKIILFDFKILLPEANRLKGELWQQHQISTLNAEPLVDQVVAFGEMVRIFFTELNAIQGTKADLQAQFHEWMAATALPSIKRDNLRLATTFTTHATMLGRYIAGNEADFYEKLSQYNWAAEARNYGIEAQAGIERAAALSAHVLTTVSDVTAKECEVFFGKYPDLVTPNGLNISRFAATHEHQNLHNRFKDNINAFVMGHFFHQKSFDLDKTLYFFTSGRYEFRNKGYDITLDALSRLNWKMKSAGMDTTVVMFFITKRPYYHIDPEVLQSRAMLDEIKQVTAEIEKQVGARLFRDSAASNDFQLPDLNQFVEEYWRLRLRRTLQVWKTNRRPQSVTHLLKESDELLEGIRNLRLQNEADDRVKVVYHPDFVNSTNPLFGLDYNQFVRGCHLGVFPSYYEPWGYTPLECIARGIPAITSDLSGFGDYVMQIMKDHNDWGVSVVRRRKQHFQQASEELAEMMFKFVKMNRRERIMLRNRAESIADTFDWSNLRSYYDTAHDLALKRRKP